MFPNQPATGSAVGRGRGKSQTWFVREKKRLRGAACASLFIGLQSDSPIMILNNSGIGDSEQDVEIRDCDFIGSYNWLQGPERTMLIPGSPPILRVPEIRPPFRLPLDVIPPKPERPSGPRMKLMPLFVAVDQYRAQTHRPAFNWREVDIVTDRLALRKLLRWARGARTNPKTREDTLFRLDLQLAGDKTVLLEEHELPPMLPPFNSYGLNFEQLLTRPAPGCEDAGGHLRIISYDLNGLRVVVRFEVDACLPELPESIDSGENPDSVANSPDVDDLIASLKAWSPLVNQPPSSKSGCSDPPSDASTVHGIVVRTQDVPSGTSLDDIVPNPTSLVELATRSAVPSKNGFSWEEDFPQLWLSQTTHHRFARHKTGEFTRPFEKREFVLGHFGNVDGQTGEVSMEGVQSQQEQFKKLRRVLGDIQALAIEHGKGTRLSLVCFKGQLKVFRWLEHEDCLPVELLSECFGNPAAPT